MRNDETINISAESLEADPQGGFRVEDIYYLLYRHKWKIILPSLLGILASGVFYLKSPHVYEAEARLLVRYVIESRRYTERDESSAVRSPDSNLINAELDMLSSLDLAKEAVSAVGASNIVSNPDDPNPVPAAISAVARGLSVDSPNRSGVLHVTFRHGDPRIAQAVLTNIISAYLKMHTRVHHDAESLAEHSRQIEISRGQIEQKMEKLSRLKRDAGIVSAEGADRLYAETLSKLQSQIMTTEADLAERRAALNSLGNSAATAAAAGGANESVAVTNNIPSEALSSYQRVLRHIAVLSGIEQAFLKENTPEAPRVQAVQAQLAEAEQQKRKLEEEHPGIATVGVTVPVLARSEGSSQTPPDPTAEIVRGVRSLDAKLNTLRGQREEFEKEALTVSERAQQISKLEREIKADSDQYYEHVRRYQGARLDEELSPGSVGNIQVVQEATGGMPARSGRSKKAASIAIGGIAFGLALAFALEFFVDQSVRRPVQVERNLRLPLFLSIPRLKLKASSKKRRSAGEPTPAQLTDGGHAGSNGDASSPDDPVTPYAEALRDRLMMHFQLNGVVHKPKLVGVTSCGHGAGVSTLATGLAASLSETGDGNVLFVDVNPKHGPSVTSFQRGKQMAGIREAFSEDTRDVARVQDNLYMVSLADPTSGKVGIIPKTLAGLLPTMKASDFDYIIFDLPPISQTSATAKVAGLLDMTFVVLESEKTPAELAKRATGLLDEARANVATILNKHRRYIPARLNTEL